MEAESKYTDKYESKFVVYVGHEETGLDWFEPGAQDLAHCSSTRS